MRSAGPADAARCACQKTTPNNLWSNSSRGIIVSRSGATGTSVTITRRRMSSRVIGTKRISFTTSRLLPRSARDWMSLLPSSSSSGGEAHRRSGEPGAATGTADHQERAKSRLSSHHERQLVLPSSWLVPSGEPLVVYSTRSNPPDGHVFPCVRQTGAQAARWTSCASRSPRRARDSIHLHNVIVAVGRSRKNAAWRIFSRQQARSTSPRSRGRRWDGVFADWTLRRSRPSRAFRAHQ